MSDRPPLGWIASGLLLGGRGGNADVSRSAQATSDAPANSGSLAQYMLPKTAIGSAKAT